MIKGKTHFKQPDTCRAEHFLMKPKIHFHNTVLKARYQQQPTIEVRTRHQSYSRSKLLSPLKFNPVNSQSVLRLSTFSFQLATNQMAELETAPPYEGDALIFQVYMMGY